MGSCSSSNNIKEQKSNLINDLKNSGHSTVKVNNAGVALINIKNTISTLIKENEKITLFARIIDQHGKFRPSVECEIPENGEIIMKIGNTNYPFILSTKENFWIRASGDHNEVELILNKEGAPLYHQQTGLTFLFTIKMVTIIVKSTNQADEKKPNEN